MREFIENQFKNMFLWVPFLMAFGAALYFSLPYEPNIFYPWIFTAIIAAAAIIKQIPVFIRAVLIFTFGFLYACAFTNTAKTPAMPYNMHNASVYARVLKIDFDNPKAKIYLQVNAQDLKSDKNQNAIIKVSAKPELTMPNIGDEINATVGLYKPSAADAPETFDYARWAYFNKISATGYLDNYKLIRASDKSNINSLRTSIHNSANSFLTDSLILGYKNAVSEKEKTVWTATGIGHVWSISGFHMTLVAGWLFAIFFFIFRAVPYITKRIPAKNPALICAWLGLLFYLFLSGIDVATIRAFLMTSLGFIAFIFNRNAISLRNICLAMCAVLLLNPHYVMQAGFQLSFAAVLGIVWLWTVVKPKMVKNKILKIIYATILTSITATVFTAPFIISQFNSFQIYSLIGNLFLLPVFSFAIMPLIILGTMSSAIGISAPLQWAHTIYNTTFHFAEQIANLPFATLNTPTIPNAAMIFIIIGFLCLIFINNIKLKINYILFVLFNSVAAYIIATNPQPAFLITQDHELAGFSENGKLEFNKSRASNHFFTFNTWKILNNEPTGTTNHRRKHNRGLYIYKTRNFTVAYMQKFMPLQKNLNQLCNNPEIDYIVSYFDINAPQCQHKIIKNGFIIYESCDIKYTTTNRPWHNPH